MLCYELFCVSSLFFNCFIILFCPSLFLKYSLHGDFGWAVKSLDTTSTLDIDRKIISMFSNHLCNARLFLEFFFINNNIFIYLACLCSQGKAVKQSYFIIKFSIEVVSFSKRTKCLLTAQLSKSSSWKHRLRVCFALSFLNSFHYFTLDHSLISFALVYFFAMLSFTQGEYKMPVCPF